MNVGVRIHRAHVKTTRIIFNCVVVFHAPSPSAQRGALKGRERIHGCVCVCAVCVCDPDDTGDAWIKTTEGGRDEDDCGDERP